MADITDPLEQARSAFARHDWSAAREAYLAARDHTDLGPDDVSALAEAAWWLGAIDECFSASEEAYRLYLHGDRPASRQAAMLALDLGFFWFLRGEMALGSGWFSRAARLLADQPDCVEQGYLRSLEIDEAIAQGDLELAVLIARDVLAIAERHEDDTLHALALVGVGIATVKQGRVTDGLKVLDEAMLPVVAGRVRPTFAGNIYCQLMSMCYELADLRRAQLWTDATARWCEGFSHAVMFLGVCRVHRAQLLTVRGEWSEAVAEARRVCEDLADMNLVAVGLGLYEIGEVHRLRGELDAAEEAYARAEELGRDPLPGRALLRVRQGRAAEAAAAIEAAVSGAADDPLACAPLRFAEVEIALACSDVERARQASDELDRIAASYGSPGLVAAATQARGAVLVAEGALDRAMEALQSSARQWQELEVPYRVAQVRVLLAEVHEGMGRADAAQVELDGAIKTFDRLGAAPDSTELRRQRSGDAQPGGLTARETEVLGLVATGLTNKEVAAALVLSEKTVARHLSNIFAKLGLSSRTAAANYAYTHGLASPPPT